MTIDNPAAEAGEAALPDGAVLSGEAHAAEMSGRSYILFILTLTYVVNYLDRQILGILLPQIQKEFILTDTQLGLLSGTAFAFIYATLGIPLATLADRMSRRNIIAVSLTTFSFMTVLSGYASAFWQLLVARFCTGIGEAGTGPSINSMISDLYPPEKRAGALAFYSAGLNIGLLIGFFGGGYIAQNYGWRPAFLASGAPGLLLVVILLLTVREPTRGLVDRIADNAAAPSLWTVTKHLWKLPSFRWIAFGCSMNAFSGYAGLYFIPKFLIVSHHMTLIQVSVALALLTGILGAIGTYTSGVLADRLGKRDIRWYMFVPILATVIAIPCGPVFYLAPSTTVALTAVMGPAFLGATYLGPSYAMAQGMVPLRMRAQTVAILLFILNFIALGFGPLTVGFISTQLQHALGSDSLRWALLSTAITTGLLAIASYWRASRTLKDDLARGGAVRAIA